MGMMDYLKNAAMSIVAPPKKPNPNINVNPGGNPYKDLNQNGPDPMLKPKKSGINLLNPAKDADRDISRNKHGHYISTITYPLPPVNWEKKEFDKNRRMRNGKNNYL